MPAHQIARLVRTSGDYTLPPAAFADIDTANLTITLTTDASWVLLLLLGTLSGGVTYHCFDFTIDGTRQGQNYGVQAVQAPYPQDIQIHWLAQLEAGSHTFRPQWRISSGSGGTLRASASYTPLVFAVIELL